MISVMKAPQPVIPDLFLCPPVSLSVSGILSVCACPIFFLFSVHSSASHLSTWLSLPLSLPQGLTPLPFCSEPFTRSIGWYNFSGMHLGLNPKVPPLATLYFIKLSIVPISMTKYLTERIHLAHSWRGDSPSRLRQ